MERVAIVFARNHFAETYAKPAQTTANASTITRGAVEFSLIDLTDIIFQVLGIRCQGLGFEYDILS